MCQFHASNEHRGHALGNDASVDYGEHTRMNKKITISTVVTTMAFAFMWLLASKKKRGK